MDARQAAQEGMRKRMKGKVASSNKQSAGKPQSLYSGNTTAKISANSVLVMSFVFMAFVMLLHVWAKVRGDRSKPAA